VNQCQICGVFIRHGKQPFEAHLQTHQQDDAPSFICSLCGKGFTIKTRFDYHMKLGKCRVLFKCGFPNCDKNCAREPQLEAHIQEKHGESEEAVSKRMCGKCGKVSVSAWHCKRHIQTVHLKENRHQCTLCEMTFAEKGTLTNHLAVVHRRDEGRVKCEVDGCSKFFFGSRQMRKHMRTDHGAYKKKRRNESQ